ncbi:MAG: PhoH family protein [Acidobacteria bacterium]|nr:MAG: PhoH family protein [Acidobacteriota bacterium]
MPTMTLAEEGLESLFGIHDKNLKRIERAFRVRLAARGGELSIEGEPRQVAVVERLLSQLSTLARSGYRLRAEDVRTAIRVLEEAPETSLIEFFQPRDDALAAVRRLVLPRSLNQHRYLRAMLEHDIVISIGPAGTGKTFLAVAMAAAFLLEKRVRRIVLARPAVEAGEKLGFLPGDLAEKVNPYLRPLHDALYDLVGYDKVGRMIERGIIEVAPIAFMRGRTLNESFVILDEAQNTTPEQMKMFLTRMGYSSKVVINGDDTQVDLEPGKVSGLDQAQRVLRGVAGIAFLRFGKRDVVRHPLVQRIVDAYERFERRQGTAASSDEDGLAGDPGAAGAEGVES